ncbi:MAG: ABC transporter substrate-binding protein [Smithellaceae bacterium]
MKLLKTRLIVVTFAFFSLVAPVYASEIVIGFSGPLSGPAAEYGQDCVNGIDMAIKEINAAGGVTADGQKFKFRLVRMDDKAMPNLAVANARELLDQTALAIFNPVSFTSEAILKINEEECGEFILMSYTSSPKLTQLKNNLLIMLAPVMTANVQVFAEMAWQRGWRKGAILVTFGGYGDEWRQMFRSYWEKIGGRITVDMPANYYTATDFTPQLKTVIDSNPDFMLIGGPSGTTALVIEQARKMGFKGGFLLVDQAKMDEIAKMLDGTRLMEDTIGSANVDSIPVPFIKQFENRYAAAYKRGNTWEAMMHYTAMRALARAIEAAGTQDNVYAVRHAVSKAMPMLGDKFPVEFHGVTKAGRILITTAVQTVKNGKFTPADLYLWWVVTKEDIAEVNKFGKYHNMLLQPLKLKIGAID